MRVNIKPIGFDMTPSFEVYVRTKLGSLGKFLKRFDTAGETEMIFEVRRSTRHHRSGDVFWGAADLRLPKNILRVEKEGSDPRVVVDVIKDKMRLEIEKYKTRFVELKKKRLSKI